MHSVLHPCQSITCKIKFFVELMEMEEFWSTFVYLANVQCSLSAEDHVSKFRVSIFGKPIESQQCTKLEGSSDCSPQMRPPFGSGVSFSAHPIPRRVGGQPSDFILAFSGGWSERQEFSLNKNLVVQKNESSKLLCCYDFVMKIIVKKLIWWVL